MDALSFLAKILPTRGYLLLGKWWQFPEPINGETGTTIYRPFGPGEYEEMAEEAIAQSKKGENVYYACSSFKEIHYKEVPEGRTHPEWWGKAGRLQSNVAYCKALWLDLDVGKPDKNKSYDTQKEAALAVAKLCKSVSIPMPLIVSSGNGLHCYWVLEQEIAADKWKRLARMLAACCDHVGVKHDSSCTSDESRILRPVGTVNPKGSKQVKVLRDAAPISVGLFAKSVVSYVNANNIKTLHIERSSTQARGMAATILGSVEYPAYSARKVAEHCDFLGHFRDTLGNVDEPEWYFALGIIKSATEGSELAHEWSQGHPTYDETKTNEKLDHWAGGPPECATVRRIAGKRCEKCKHKVMYPSQLGREITQASVTPQAADDAASKPTIPFCPEGFRWTGTALVQEVPDKDGVIRDVVFSDTLWFATNRVRGEDGTWNLRMKMSVAGHEWREFDLPQTLIPDPRGFQKHLAKYEIMVLNPFPAQYYTKGMVNMLMAHLQQTTTYNRFGWDEGRFVVGSTAFLPIGTTEEVLLSTNVINSERGVECTPKGDLQTWIDLMDDAYNRPNAEPFQFIVCACGFASPLVPLMDFTNYRGIPVVLSGEGGIGKSSVFKAANTIYASPNVLTADASTKGGATLQGLLGLASMFNGVPILFDELTERDDKDFTPMMYSLSNGIGKTRLKADGSFAKSVPPFAGIPGGTSNASITDKIYAEEKKDVSDAASARCFEIGGLTKGGLEAVFHGTDMKELLEHNLFENHGVAAQVYLPYIAKNKDRIRQVVSQMRIKLGSDAESESRERFYIDTIAFAYVAGSIAFKLGLIKWDVKAMTKWALAHVKTLRRTYRERNALAEDNISLFFRWLYGSTIVTKSFPSGGKVKQDDIEPLMETIRDKPKARIAVKDRKMFVTINALQEWCKECDFIYEKMRDKLKAENYIVAERREYIGKGTHTHVGQTRVYEINYDKVVGSLHTIKSFDAGDGEAAAVTAAVT